jgi:putative oxidoreductase
MFHRLLHTPDDHTLTLIRLGLGAVFFAHGAQKMLGWFGGSGYPATVNFFIHMGFPEVLAVLAIFAEFFGGIGLIFGLFSRIAAFALAVEMCVAVLRVHLANGFFMNWLGTQRGEGFEFHILAICMLFTVMVRGAGAWSIDHLIDRNSRFHAAPVRYQPQPTG